MRRPPSWRGPAPRSRKCRSRRPATACCSCMPTSWPTRPRNRWPTNAWSTPRSSAPRSSPCSKPRAHHGRGTSTQPGARRGCARVDLWFDRYDVLLTPSASGEAPFADLGTGDPQFSRGWTLFGLPCLNPPFATGARAAGGLAGGRPASRGPSHAGHLRLDARTAAGRAGAGHRRIGHLAARLSSRRDARAPARGFASWNSPSERGPAARTARLLPGGRLSSSWSGPTIKSPQQPVWLLRAASSPRARRWCARRAVGGAWRAAADVSCLGADHAASAVSCSVASAPALMWRLTALSTAWNEAVTMSRSMPTPKPVPESPTRSST